MYKEVFAALLLGVVAFPALSDEEGVLIPEVSNIADSDGVLNLVAQAFAGRQWAVKSKDHLAVTAELEGIEMKISISGESLIYWHNAKPSTQRAGPMSLQQTDSRSLKATRWRANLKKDLEVLLAQRPFQSVVGSASTTPAQTAASIADRLKAVESLKDAGVITEVEYTKKRGEILDSL